MRTFYIFNINDSFYSLYNESPTSIYNVLKQISNIMPNDSKYATNIFYQINKNINKQEMDKDLFIKMHQDYTYKKLGDTHIYNDLYLDEVSIMEIKNNYIKIKSNKNYSFFFKYLGEYKYNFFVCDFKNKDYFFLSKLKNLVK